MSVVKLPTQVVCFQGVSGGSKVNTPSKTRLGMGRGRRLENMSKQKLHAPEYEAKKQQQQQQDVDAEHVRVHSLRSLTQLSV